MVILSPAFPANSLQWERRNVSNRDLSFGPPDVLKPVERPQPVPQPDEVLIRVEAAGVARADTMQRQGKYPPPPGASDIPGLDIAGIVHSVGTLVHEYRPGDRVCAILAGGGYAEFCAVPALQVLPTPDNWTSIEAATLPENLFTVYDNVVTRAGLNRGDSVLIHGGRAESAAWALCSAAPSEPLLSPPPEAPLNAKHVSASAQRARSTTTKSDFVVETKRLTDGRGVDIVVDLVGAPYLEKNLDCLALEGRITIISAQGGRNGKLDISQLMHKRARVMGSTMRIRSPQQKGEVARRLKSQIWPLLPAKDFIRPIIDSTFPLKDASLAHQRLEEGKHIGKIVLVP